VRLDRHALEGVALLPTTCDSGNDVVSHDSGTFSVHQESAIQTLAPHPRVGSAARPLRIAVFGAGPAGFFAVEELLKQPGRAITVDLFDRLPTPYGLVRGGVAPDHQNTKRVIKHFERTAAFPGFRFFGNVTFGVDLSLAEVLAHYHQVLFATGAEADRRLGIPGEDLPGSHPATSFVGWYNGHPDYRDARFDFSAEQVAVVGNGNVAVDVARILARSVDDLASTDIAEQALESLRHTRVKEVFLLGRRGPAQAAFSHPELRELTMLAGVDLVVRAEDLELDTVNRTFLERHPSRHPQRNWDLLAAHRARGEGTQPRKIRMRFFVSPVEILGTHRVEGLRVERNRLVEDGQGGFSARGTGVFEEIPSQLVFRSVGYKGRPLAGVPFDDQQGIIPHQEGRVIDPLTNAPLQRVYVAGWIKRGPSGVIGTNRPDAVATVRVMLADAEGGSRGDTVSSNPDGVLALLARKHIRTVTFEEWARIDTIERASGERRGKPREKFTTVAELMTARD
jgi:ferredoxin/flavodoxin---NADP+ reductase